jgi:HEAT repeat protein
MTEHQVKLWIQDFENDQLPVPARLEAASRLLVVDHPAAASAVVRFLDLADSETSLGQSYRELVVTQGAAVDALCVLLWEADLSLQLAAADSLREIGDPAVVPELAAILSLQRARRCRSIDLIIAIIESLGGCWRMGDPSVALAVVNALSDSEEDIRDAAGGVLRQLGSDAAAATPHLVSLLSASGFEQRFEAVELLPQLTKPETYAPHLIRVLQVDEDSLLRWMALLELKRIKQPSQNIRLALEAALFDIGIQEYAVAA